MSQYILLNRIKVQNANTIAGFTWGFPAITHFLGFTHNLERKLADFGHFSGVKLNGCAVVAHHQQVHAYRASAYYEFTQSRNPPYLHSHDKAATPPIIEEGKMNMTVSLLIGCEGNIGNRVDSFLQWIEKTSQLQRLAGGTVLSIASVQLCNLDNENELRAIKRQLLPGFVLCDRSDYLASHLLKRQQENPNVELLDAWLDFCALKQQARPKSKLINQHLAKLAIGEEGIELQLIKDWQQHLLKPYEIAGVPNSIKHYFLQIESNKSTKALLSQWQNYCEPTAKTDADWEYQPKPESGYLVPIMTGYKAISAVYDNEKIACTRDNETPVCFVESVHSIGEWKSVHRITDEQELKHFLWQYHHEKDWYLCKQPKKTGKGTTMPVFTTENADEEFC